MMEGETLSQIFDSKIVRTIESLLNHNSEFFSIREISEKSGVTVSSTFRVIKQLEKVGMVRKVKRGNVKFFQIRKTSKPYKDLAKIFGKKKAIKRLIESELKNRYENISFDLFSPKKDKSKIFIVTEENVDDSKISKKLAEATDKKLNIMSIKPNQFNKMRGMGLI